MVRKPRADSVRNRGLILAAARQAIADRGELEKLVEETTRRFEGLDVPRPPYWGGFVLRPIAFEFWQGRPSRLHDRFRYSLADSSWSVQRLAP